MAQIDYTAQKWEELTSVPEAARRVQIKRNRRDAYQRALQLKDDLMVAALAPVFGLDRENTGRAGVVEVEEDLEGFEKAWNAPLGAS